MKRVIIFGAGASMHMGVPTMDRFIDTADDLRTAASSSITANHFELFFNVIQDRFRQLHAKSSVNLNNIESVFGLVEMARLLGRLPGFDHSQIEELAAAIRTVLVETVMLSGTFVYTPQPQWRPPSQYLTVARQFELSDRQSNDELSLITFNYDLGLDFALHFVNLEIDYGLQPVSRNNVRLYKLHGSLNWVTCKKCGAVRPIPMRQVFGPYAKATLSRHDENVRLPLDPRRAHASLGPHCPGDDRPFEITLVPPSWNKTQYWKQLADVWSAAAREIASAHEIIIIGYSLPGSDSFFRDLLALGLEGPTRLRAFRVVNPDATVASRFESLLGPETRERFQAVPKTFAAWLNEAVQPNGRGWLL